MLEEAINDDLIFLLGNIGCSEGHFFKLKCNKRAEIGRLKRDGKKEEEIIAKNKELDLLSNRERQLRLLRQQFTKLYINIPRNFNESEKNHRASPEEWGCLFKHSAMGIFLCQEIDEKFDYLIANAEKDKDDIKAWRDDILIAGNLFYEMVDMTTENIKRAIGLEE